MANFFETRRAELGLTQRQIAEAFRPTITPSAVGAWETGIAAPEMRRADEVAAIYRVSRRRILDAIHEIAVARQEKPSASAART